MPTQVDTIVNGHTKHDDNVVKDGLQHRVSQCDTVRDAVEHCNPVDVPNSNCEPVEHGQLDAVALQHTKLDADTNYQHFNDAIEDPNIGMLHTHRVHTFSVCCNAGKCNRCSPYYSF